jgi:hypothetical protein
MATVHIDETAGSDDNGVGSIEQPYQSLAFALYSASDTTPKVLTRKDPNSEYDEPTQSALKKAKKLAEGIEKKKKKAQELAERAATAQNADRERREKELEESRNIILKEDENLPKATTVRVIDSGRMFHSHRDYRASSALSNLFVVSGSEFEAGFTVSVIRRASSSSSSEMGLAIFKQSYLV